MIGVLRETLEGETRVAMVPASVARLKAKGHEIWVQTGAGRAALHEDSAYEQAGARVVEGCPEADWLLGVHLPEQVPSGALALGLLGLRNPPKGRYLALEKLPRLARAQAMDVLSSQAAVAGYKGVLMGAAAMPRFMPMLSTAAGTIRPAKVLVMGVGVAGLMAIATAHRMGALVFGYDVRPETAEQVRSLGATFVGTVQASGEGGYARALTEEETQAQRAQLMQHLGDKDLILTCALVPGRKAPILLTREMGAALSPGTVVVDLAADKGGNCEDAAQWGQVHYIAPLNFPALVPVDASQMFSRNMESLLDHLKTLENLEGDELIGPMLGGT